LDDQSPVWCWRWLSVSQPGFAKVIDGKAPFLLVEAQLHCWWTKIKSNSREIPVNFHYIPMKRYWGALVQTNPSPKKRIGALLHHPE
jgi:hypothetical protein